jgi:hypothetical protein
LNSLKYFTEKLSIEVFEQTLKTRVQGDEFHGRASRHLGDFIRKKGQSEFFEEKS